MGAPPRRSARRKEERSTVRYPQGGAKRSSEGYMPSSHARYHDQRTWRRLRARVPSVRGERPKARKLCRGEAGVRRCPRSVGFSAESPNTGSPVSENSLCRKPVCENLEYWKLSFRDLPFSAIQRIRGEAATPWPSP